ncbi:MAG: GHKL domain-containing protein [Lachnospiraceae bacterium]|nr:GHKL domain-containing protein [Lachnospiraceae bacterium]
MGRYEQLKQEYDKLNEQYMQLFAKNQELEYSYVHLQSQVEEREKQDLEIRNLHQATRKLKHDMKNHFMVLSSFLATEDYDKAREYSSEVIDQLNAMNTYVETGNVLLNHILNEKFSVARNHGISVKAEIENLAFAKVNSMDFSSVLTNLLDNAIEASMEVKHVEKEIQLLVSKRQGYEVICVKNRTDHSVLDTNPTLQSSKTTNRESHGIGVSRVKEIVESYNGIYDIYEEDNYFCFSVFIPEE